MKGRFAVTTALAALAAAPPALAANADVQAVDGPTGVNDNSWSPAAVNVNVGDAVTWHFNTVGSHNVRSTSANWAVETPFRRAGDPPATFTFTAEGIYDYVCGLHAEMTGRVTVGTPPPPPPPPLSEQPFANDQPPPTVLEITDEQRPRLTRVRASDVNGAARVRFRLDEPGRVTVRLERGSRTVRSRTVRLRRAGSRAVTLRGLKAGTYRVEVRARDLAANRSRLKTLRLVLR